MDEFENKSPETPVDPEIRFRSPFVKKLDNFFYHYKWHVIAAVFIVFVLIVVFTQISKREFADVYFMYAGEHEVARTASDGGMPQAKVMEQSLARVAPDSDGNESVTTSLLPLFLLTNEQIEELNHAGEYEPNVPLIKDNLSVFMQNLLYSDYYICLLSPEVYETYKTRDGVILFQPLAPYVTGSDAVFYDDEAIVLSSLEISSLPGFADLPDDTLIALRPLSELAKRSGKTKKMYDASVETFRRIVSFSK